ncbi:hypothetical protein B2J93_4123 [Marssonina coronariae]|uniref:Uncharacterized protein n=1 Tax=Diplocarpon coronariae TaxID=2795749 RepID=A0A218YTY4_9HELO|nr:hypothetical protein B2J93_4123 [Marssonina coronariae]
MGSGSYGPVEGVSSLPRRTSTGYSPRLEGASGRVDDDIASRVRALLLSRNGHCPPRTPNPSDEPHPRYSRGCDRVGGFDPSSAESVARLARRVTGRLSDPEVVKTRSESAEKAMESPQPALRSTLRESSSADDLIELTDPDFSPGRKNKSWFPKLVLQDRKKPEPEGIKSCIEISPLRPQDDSAVHDDDLDCCPPCDPRDPQPSKYLLKHSKLPSHGLEVEASDLACFMAGCNPGLKNCSIHRRRSNSVSTRTASQERRTDEDFNSIPDGLLKLGITVKNIRSAKMRPPTIVTGDAHESASSSQEGPGGKLSSSAGKPREPREEVRRSLAARPGRSRKALRSPVERAISPISSATSGSTMDAFPLALHSLELAAKEDSPTPFSTTVATNFSLPGYKRASQTLRTKLAEGATQLDQERRAKQARASITRKPVPLNGQDGETKAGVPRAKVTFSPGSVFSDPEVDRKQSDAPVSPTHTDQEPLPRQSSVQAANSIREKRSDASLRSFNGSFKSKPYSPSLLSGASRTSVIRHALLKSPVPDPQPLDTGLPVPPLLSAISSLSEQVMPGETAYEGIARSAGPDPKGEEVRREAGFSKVPEPMGGESEEKRYTAVPKNVPRPPYSASLGDPSPKDGDDRVDDAPEADRSKPLGTRDAVRFPIFGHLAGLQKASDTGDIVRGRIQEAQGQMIEATAFENPADPSKSDLPVSRGYEETAPEDALRTALKQAGPSVPSPKGPASPPSHDLVDCKPSTQKQDAVVPSEAQEERLSGPVAAIDTQPRDTLDSATLPDKNMPNSSEATQRNRTQLPLHPSNAAYWGFVPAVKEAVQNAVQIAVRNAVQEIVIPPGMDRSSDEYRRLVSESLARASKKADEHIQRASAARYDALSGEESEATVILSNRDPTRAQPSESRTKSSDRVPEAQLAYVAESPSSSLYPGSASSRDQENSRGRGTEAGKAASPPPGCGPRRFSASGPHSQALSPRPMSPNELETIALDAGETPSLNDHNEAWKLSQAWRKGSSAGYTRIPTRHSSRNRVLGPKTRATNASAKVSAQGSLMGSRQRSYERLVPRNGRGLRSISSAGSLGSAGSVENEEHVMSASAKKPSLDRRNSTSSATREFPEGKLGRKNTVHWLKDLFSTNGAYETRFTALPPRTRNDRPARSQTAPVKPAVALYLGRTQQPTFAEAEITRPAGIKTRDKRTDISETFTRTIKDLESLMSEALLIARAATDSPGAANLQFDLENSVNGLQKSQKGPPRPTDALASTLRRGRARSRQSTTYCSDSDSSSVSVHESLQDYSETSSEEEDRARSPAQLRSITISEKKVPSRHSSGWPPTGRISSPYPPASCPQSRASMATEGPQELSRHGSLDRIKAADPRSMRTETHVDVPKMSMASQEPRSNRDSDPAIPSRTGSRRTTAATFPAMDPEDEYLDENEAVPNFTLEPFSPRPAREDRKSSAKSPRRLSPQRNTVTSTTGVAPDENVPAVAENVGPLPQLTPIRGRSFAPVCIRQHSEEDHREIRAKLASKDVPGKQEVRDYILQYHLPPITPRASSLNLRKGAEQEQARSRLVSTHTFQTGETGKTYNWQDIDLSKVEPCCRPASRGASRGPAIAPEPEMIDPNRRQYSHSLDGSQLTRSEVLDFDTGYGVRHRGGAGDAGRSRGGREAIELRDVPNPDLPPTNKGQSSSKRNHFSLGGKRHISLKEHHLKGFSLARSHKKQTIARDWSPGRKRFVATVACISTALVGILVGIYAGETPAIQYMIVDFHHYTVLGNVFFFIGLAIPTVFFWPLPLLHGRKPYIMGAMSLAMPLLFPQALAVGEFRSPYVSTWRVALIMSRALMGFCLGFANMNFKQMLTDLFGASLQSTNPHQEHVDEFDVRRHGGGMGIWLGLWTWSALGSIGLGFMIGAIIINHLNPAWGFYVSICIIAFVMLLNVLCPEVRRSAFRRSVAEVVNDGDVSRRLARGEVKMHMVKSGPKWWGEEFHAGVMLTQRMLRQPGFLIMALYVSWIYGQQVLITLLLGALMSKDYKFTSPAVGASVLAIPLGALVAIPFQKASIFSRARQIGPASDDGTFKKKISWTSHMVRRSIFMLVLPVAGIGYTVSSGGPPTPFIIPILFAALIGFLSNLAMAECHGILMETFDTSDLQPGMTGRSKSSGGSKGAKRTNYSSFPRVASAFAITQGFGYLIAAAASGVGGALTRHLGQQAATGVMAGILFVLSILLLGTLIRFTDVQIIPDSRKEEMEQYHNARRVSAIRKEEGVQEDEPWRPIIIGNPHHTTRRMCLLELGSMSRFSEIRIKNKLVDEQSLEAKHPNQAAMNNLGQKIHDKEMEVVNHVRRSLSRHSSRGSRRSDGPEQGDLGGHREMLKRGGSGNGSGSGRQALSRGASGRDSGRKGTSTARRVIEE